MFHKSVYLTWINCPVAVAVSGCEQPGFCVLRGSRQTWGEDAKTQKSLRGWKSCKLAVEAFLSNAVAMLCCDFRGHRGPAGGSHGSGRAVCLVTSFHTFWGTFVPARFALICLSSSVSVCPQGKLVKYFSRQLSCKCKVALEERSAELEDFPRLGHWFRIVNLRKEVTQVTFSLFQIETPVLFSRSFVFRSPSIIFKGSHQSVVNWFLQEMSPGEVTLEGLLDMSEEQVCELLQKFGANEEECARLNASLSCLRKAHQLGRGPETSRTNPHIHRNK